MYRVSDHHLLLFHLVLLYYYYFSFFIGVLIHTHVKLTFKGDLNHMFTVYYCGDHQKFVWSVIFLSDFDQLRRMFRLK